MATGESYFSTELRLFKNAIETAEAVATQNLMLASVSGEPVPDFPKLVRSGVAIQDRQQSSQPDAEDEHVAVQGSPEMALFGPIGGIDAADALAQFAEE
jgi:hypothetical protein